MEVLDLVEIEAIKQLKARYCRFLDEKRWGDWGRVFTEDAQLDTTEDVPNGKVSGRREIVAFVSAALEGVVTVHHGHMPEIEITGSNTARGVWSMEDHLEYPGEPPHFVIRGRGHYHEEYEKQEDGVWRIKTLRLTRLRLDREGTPAASFLASQQ